MVPPLARRVRSRVPCSSLLVPSEDQQTRGPFCSPMTRRALGSRRRAGCQPQYMDTEPTERHVFSLARLASSSPAPGCASCAAAVAVQELMGVYVKAGSRTPIMGERSSLRASATSNLSLPRHRHCGALNAVTDSEARDAPAGSLKAGLSPGAARFSPSTARAEITTRRAACHPQTRS